MIVAVTNNRPYPLFSVIHFTSNKSLFVTMIDYLQFFGLTLLDTEIELLQVLI